MKDKSYNSDNPKHRFYVVFGPDKARGPADVAVALFPLSSFLWDIAEDVPSDSFSVTAPVYLYDRPETCKWENLALSRLKSMVKEMADEHARMTTQLLVTEMAVCSLCGKSRPTAEFHKVNPSYFFCQDTCWNRRGKILGSKYTGALNCPFYNEGMCNVDGGNTCSLSYGNYDTTCFVYRIGKTRRF